MSVDNPVVSLELVDSTHLARLGFSPLLLFKAYGKPIVHTPHALNFIFAFDRHPPACSSRRGRGPVAHADF